MADNFIIDPTSISQPQIKEDLTIWLDSKPDADKWAVFFASSTGKALIDLTAGLAAYFQYSTITARREAYIQFAKNRSSIIGSSQFLGYSSYRGRNAVIDVTIIPESSGLFTKWEDIGTVKDRRLIVLEDTVKNVGVPVTVRCVIGEILEQTKIAPNDSLNVFKFTTAGVSEDIRLYVGNNEVEVGTEVSDMLLGKFVIQSNAFGSVDAKSLNLTGSANRYDSGTEIKLEWISLKDVNFSLSDVQLDLGQGVIDGLSVFSIYQAVEILSSIAVNAPLKNETGNAVRGRRDQAKIFKQLTPKCVDAKGKDVSSAIMRIFYVLVNDLRLTQDEKANILELFEDYRPHGLLPPYIEDATRNKTKLKIDIFLAPKKSGNISETCTSILSTKQYKLGSALSLYSIEDELEATDFIKVARVSLTGDIRLSDSLYEVGTIVKRSPDNGLVYRAARILYFSGSTEPVWPTVTGALITDGTLVWKAVPKDDASLFSYWSPNMEYQTLSYVRPSVPNAFIYQVVNFINKSGATEPVWPILDGELPETMIGKYIQDKDILWVGRPLEGTVSDWAPNTLYNRGDLVVPTDPITSDTVGVMFQVYAYLGKAGPATPTYPTTIDQRFIDGNIEWNTLDPKADVVTLEDNEYFVLEFQTTVSN